uniref:uncharacterized protein LOC120348276 n=1 Tax=Styela clava TaxID=7725 RepID=UPI0019398B95|nr:uncharacterized protein LOC120348276 [Styela clava]
MRLLQKHENCEFTALREFKNLTANVTCSQGNFRENLMKEIEEKLFQYRQINRKNHDEEKQKHINALTDEYEASMKKWTERFCPEDDVMKMKYSMMSVDVLEKFSRLMNSKETAEDKEELKKGINGVYLKIEAENKKARDEREFLERQKELDMKILKVNSEIRRNDFIQSIKSCENIYHEDFENIFSNVMLEVLEEFDEETKDLGDSLDKKILEARIDLEKTIQGVLNRGIQENNENKERVDDAVQAYVLKYREVLGELMLNAYVDTSGFKEIEKHHIEEVDAQDGNDAIKELIKKEIRKRTEKAKLQNERNKEYRPVIANEDTVAKYLAIGWITITSPIWIPLGLVGVVLGGVVGGIVAGVMTFKDFIKKKMNAKK